MKYHPNFIILKQISRYLTKVEQSILSNKLYNQNIKNKLFLNYITNFFDIERLKNNPLIWQDIWLYNYIKYDTLEGVKRKGLIVKYEKEVFIIDDTEFFNKKDIINQQLLAPQKISKSKLKTTKK